MARGRRRITRAQRSGGSSLPWLWLGALVLIGGGILFARETRLGRALLEPPVSAEPTVTSTRVAVRPTAPTAIANAAQPLGAPTPQSALARPATASPTAAVGGPARASTAGATPHAGPTAASATALRATTPAAIATGATAVPAAASATALRATTPAAIATGATAVGVSAGHLPAAGEVALTFDAGADRGYAQDILDLLGDEHISASFGVTGQWAQANPDLVRRMAADGHFVFNHSLDHRSFTGLSDRLGGLSSARRRAELEEADAIIAPLLGHTTRPFYRLPYGDDDAQVAADVQPSGYTRKVGWTVDSWGWRGAQAADIVTRCLSLAAPGGVYLLHVGRASQDAIALPQIIRGLRDRGFGFRRVDP